MPWEPNNPALCGCRSGWTPDRSESRISCPASTTVASHLGSHRGSGPWNLTTMTMKDGPTPPQFLDDSNQSAERKAWQARALDGTTRQLLAEDGRYFLAQSMSTPCL